MILAGDIGGTNARLALFEKSLHCVEDHVFPSSKYQSLESILKEFLGSKKPQKACFGVAGPVREQKSHITNLPWIIDAKKISQELQIPSVSLLNDLEANAWGIFVLKEEEFFVLQKGKEQKGNQALISAGTGLGEAGLFWNGKEHIPFACEGGHSDFSVRNEEEWELFCYLQKKFGHVSFERVVSGPGLVEIFQFLIDTKKETLKEEVKKEMEKNAPAKVISDWGLKGKDSACQRALEWFISLYGAEGGNLALKFLALGGVFIGGGIAPHLVEKMKKGAFLSSFHEKGRFEELLLTIPIKVIMNDQTALLGAANFARRV